MDSPAHRHFPDAGAVLGGLAAGVSRRHGYGLIYFYVSVAPTWLLSGPRYLTALYAVYPALAVLLRKKAAFALLAIAFGLLCLVSGGMFAGYGCIL